LEQDTKFEANSRNYAPAELVETVVRM
jgi:hypothetical protein